MLVRLQYEVRVGVKWGCGTKRERIESAGVEKRPLPSRMNVLVELTN